MNRTLLMGIFLLVGIGAGVFLTWPKYQDFQQARAELASLERELENREAYFADLAGVKATLGEFPDELAKLEAALPSDAQLPALYDFLQGASALSGMSVRSISVSFPQQTKPLVMRTIPSILELTGSYQATKSLLARLHTASRFSDVRSLNVASGADPGRFNVRIQLHSYSY